MNKDTILVCGVTGQQGGEVLKTLIEKGNYNLRAITRNKKNPKILYFKEKGVEIFEANLEDKETLKEAFKGTTKVFLVTQPWSPDNKKCFSEKEILQGKNVIEMCKEEGVKYIVYTSMINLGYKNTKVAHLESKLKVEDLLKESGISYAIFKLPSFMENIGKDFFPIKKNYVRGLLEKDIKTTYISCKDIGFFVLKAFEEFEKFKDKTINLISDLKNGEELAEILSLILKRKIKYKSAPKIVLKLFAKEFYEMKIFYEKLGKPPDLFKLEEIMKETKKLHPYLITLKRYLEENYKFSNL